MRTSSDNGNIPRVRKALTISDITDKSSGKKVSTKILVVIGSRVHDALEDDVMYFSFTSWFKTVGSNSGDGRQLSGSMVT